MRDALAGAPASLPAPHRSFLERAVPLLAADQRLVGVAAGGSYLAGAMDEFSDLDLVIAVEPDAYAAVLVERRTIAARLGPLLQAFTGEHVGEPRLLICLYDAPLLHVDLKFVALPDVARRVEDPAILWQRDGRLAAALVGGRAAYPAPSPDWIEQRFWIWVHYVAGKIGRGELFEAIDALSMLRARVLGPLGLLRAGAQPAGVRKLEQVAPELARRLEKTLPRHDALDCVRALRATVAVYRDLRAPLGSSTPSAVESAALRYVDEIEGRSRGARSA